MDAQSDFRMTDLEEQLAAPNGATVKADTLSWLESAGQGIKGKLDAGLPPQTYQTATLIYQALAAAHEVVSAYPVGGADQTISQKG